jgi:hypothetical protein
MIQEHGTFAGYGILVLIPDFYQPEENIQVLDPSPAVGEIINNRASWPGAVFMIRTGETSFAPMDEARRRVHLLFDAMRDIGRNLEAVRQLALQPSKAEEDFADRAKPIKLLHLSDLHLGTQRAADVQMYVYTQLARYVKDVYQIVITGDLFDQPRRRHAQQYKNFADHLQHLSTKPPIIVPGITINESSATVCSDWVESCASLSICDGRKLRSTNKPR